MDMWVLITIGMIFVVLGICLAYDLVTSEEDEYEYWTVIK